MKNPIYFSFFFLYIFITSSVIKLLDNNYCNIDNCEECNGYSGCKKCKDEFVLDSNGYSCYSCPKKCKICEAVGFYETSCTECYIGYYESGSNKKSCSKCEDDNCKKCSGPGDTCTECSTGYAQIKGKCVKCHNSCKICSGSEPYECTECANGYYKETQDSKEYCLSCGDNCTECTLKTCSKCIDGYYLEESTHKCRQCDNSCKKCNGPNITSCTECKDGFYFYGNQCRACDSNCKTCAGAKNLCTSWIVP